MFWRWTFWRVSMNVNDTSVKPWACEDIKWPSTFVRRPKIAYGMHCMFCDSISYRWVYFQVGHAFLQHVTVRLLSSHWLAVLWLWKPSLYSLKVSVLWCCPKVLDEFCRASSRTSSTRDASCIDVSQAVNATFAKDIAPKAWFKSLIRFAFDASDL